jgi:hypothetical protein
MSEEPDRHDDEDPEPTKHSDAQRLSGEEAERVPKGGDTRSEESDDDAA